MEGDQMQKQLDREIREMVSALINLLGQLQNNPDHHVQQPHPAGSSHLQAAHEVNDHEENHGVRIVTLAGSNTGATMRGELDGKVNGKAHGLQGQGPGQINGHDEEDEEEEGLGTYVNSNFQAINNSIMLGGKYSTNDPGVHLDISDFLHHPAPHANMMKQARKSKPNTKEEEEEEEEETSRSRHHHSEPSSEGGQV